MHSSLMSSIGVRPEVTRDNMGHATVEVTQNAHNRTWWEERVEAVSMAAATVWREFLAQPVPAQRMQVLLEVLKIWLTLQVVERNWSGREDLNLRPPGPELGCEEPISLALKHLGGASTVSFLLNHASFGVM